MSKSKKRFSKIIFIFLCLLFVGGLLALIVLNNINIAENWFGINEYELAEMKNQLIQVVPYIWYSVIGLFIVISLIMGVKKRRKPLYWLAMLVIFPLIMLIIGGVSTTIPFDKNNFREEKKAEEIMTSLSELKLLKGKDLQLISFSFHIRNVPLKSGVYAVTRVINPTTDLQDEYWYWSTNPLMKWRKDADEFPIPAQKTISFDEIDWKVIPKVIKETEHRVNKLDTYYPGVSIVILGDAGDRWTWTVGIQDVRGRTSLNMVYDLEGNYHSEWS